MGIEKGQLSKIILSSLYDEDKYVNEIFDFVNQISSSNSKQINLYSTLKKLENQQLISSYWRENDVGAKRHYYSITDYGKKSIDKWGKIDLSTNKNSNITNSVIVQPKLFDNLTEEKNKANDIFVQYNLFENNSSISLPSNNTKQTNELTIKENNIEPSKSDDNYSFTNDTIFNKLYNEKRGNSSFTDSQKNVQLNTNKLDNHDDIKIDDIKAPTFDFTNKTIVNLDDIYTKTELNVVKSDIVNENENPIKHNIMESKENTDITSTKEKFDDAVFITEKPDESQIKKVKRIEPSRFDIYLSDHSISPTLDEKFRKVPYQDRIKELYEKSKQNIDNKDIKIQNNNSFNNYEELEDFYKNEDLKFYSYKKQSTKNSNFLYINKLNLTLSFIFFMINSIICLTSLFCIKKSIIDMTFSKFMLCTVSFLTIAQFIYFLYKFIANKNKYIYNQFEMHYINKFIISLLLIVILLIINFACGFNFKNITYYYFSLIFPTLIICSYLIILFGKKILSKKFEL